MQPPPSLGRVFHAQLEERLLVDLGAHVVCASEGFHRARAEDAVLGGETPPVFEGKLLWTLAPFASHGHLRDELKRLLATAQNTRLTLALPLTEGPFAEVEAAPVLSDAGEVTHYTLTFRRVVEQPKASHESRLAKLIDDSYEGLGLFDITGHTLFASRSFRRQLGYSDDAPEVTLPLGHVHPEDARRLGELLANLVAGRDSLFSARVRVRTLQGDYRVLAVSTRNLLHDPDIRALVVHTYDLTDDVALHAELERAHTATKIALKAARALSWDVQTGGAGFYSEDFCAYYGLSQEAYEREGPLAAVHPSSRSRMPDLRSMPNDSSEFNLEFRGPDRDDKPRWYVAFGIVERDAHGALVRVTGVTRDISDQKRLAEERAALDQQIREGQKLESLGVLAGGIAHDFNNLLTAILGHASLASARTEGAAKLHLERIEEASLRASELCRQMLSYAGRGSLSLHNTDLNRLVGDTLQLLQVSLNKKASLALFLAPSLPLIEGDATQLRQVLMNLVINAAEAVGEHPGQIAIRTETVQASRAELDRYGAVDLAPAHYVQLQVEDTGSGMPPEVVSRIFEPFFSTKFTGRGLGLSAVLGIVKSHGGALRVESTQGEGTTFSLLFPVSHRTSSLPASENLTPQQDTFSGTVLLAEDEEAVRTVTQQMLESLGFRVVATAHGADAVKRYEPGMNLILMDLTMPILTGEEALRALRETGVETPIVLMSGHAEADAMARLAGERGVSFLPKPFTLEQLRAHLQQQQRPQRAPHDQGAAQD